MNQKEHGTTDSYIIGFLLSVVCTVIPYYMVVNHSFSGTTLLVAILGFAVLQMLIQILFFLHLGRGPKPMYNIVFFAATVSFILVVVGGSLFIMKHLQYNMSAQEVTTKLAQSEGISQIEDKKTGACPETRANHQVIFDGSKVSPLHIQARLCDTLTFIAQDKAVHQVGFGSHPRHDSYAGQNDLLVRSGKNKTITLNQAGTYDFHDHLNDALAGDFTVEP